MKQLKRRLVAGAMIAFAILLVLIIGGIVIFGQVQMENDTDMFIDRMLSEKPPEKPQSGPPIFGYRPENRSAPAGYFDLLIDSDGTTIRQKAFGILDQDSTDIESMTERVMRDEKNRGKIGIYKYGKSETNGVTRIILLDNAIQIQTMYSILRSAAIVGLVCLVLMFFILQPIARYIARANMASQERERQFITNASHELKTPVAAIQANIEAMEMVRGEDKWSRNAHHQVLRLNHMISQLLMMERIDETRMKQRPVPVDLTALIRSVSAEMRELMEQRQLQLEVQCAEKLWVSGNEEALTQLLRILLDNAAKYAEQASRVTLSVIPGKKDMTLQCENRVETLPACAPEKLFERFERGGIQRKPDDRGCGIGLSAAASVVSMHHGNIGASYPDEHTFAISVRIPRGKGIAGSDETNVS
ncbi:MAG: HAMP domain-containing sensor histidine kinase [Clostridia bacterium]|nr:HAMP domain-containing sensor histidine kinase [Clostridia bacterium]